MRKTLRNIGWFMLGFTGLLIILLVIVPLVVPIPPPGDVLPVEALADPDSQFVPIDGIQFHYKSTGSGDPAIVLLHGFGASLYSWREVMPALAENHAVYIYDRPAFGLTERPTTWSGENPYSQQASVTQLGSLLDAWGLDKVILVGNSAGGRTAMEYTLAHPEHVEALILVSPAAGSRESSMDKFPWIFDLPQVQRLGPLLVRNIANSGLDTLQNAWHDPSRQPEDTIPLYTKPLQAENWDIALWHYSTAGGTSDLPNRLDEFDLPILLITGDDDRIVSTASTLTLQDKLPGSELVVIPDCGHVPQEECPIHFLQAVEYFLLSLKK